MCDAWPIGTMLKTDSGDTVLSYDIFLSYRRSDRPIARDLVAELEARGVAVWWDEKIEGGEDWRDAIVDGLERSSSLVILFSDECNASKQLKKELAIADTLDKLIIPVLIEETQPKGHYLYELASRNWIQIFPNAEQKTAKLAEKLAATLDGADLLSRPSSPAEAPAAAPSPTETAPAPTARAAAPKPKKTKPAKPAKRTRRDFLPFKWIDLLPLGAGLVGIFYLMSSQGDLDMDNPLEALGQLVGLGALLLGAYGALVFPIRYFMRGRRVGRAALMYALSSIVLLGLFFGGLILWWEGDIESSIDDLIIGAVIWGAMAVVAIVLYAILSGIRAARNFRKNVEVI